MLFTDLLLIKDENKNLYNFMSYIDNEAFIYFDRKFSGHLTDEMIINELISYPENRLSYYKTEVLYYYIWEHIFVGDLDDEVQQQVEKQRIMNITNAYVLHRLSILNGHTVSESHCFLFTYTMGRLFEFVRNLGELIQDDLYLFRNVLTLPIATDVFYRFFQDALDCLAYHFKDDSGLNLFLEYLPTVSQDIFDEYCDDIIERLKENGKLPSDYEFKPISD